MSKTFDNTNSGALFKNDKKGNEKAPDYTGKLNVNGEEWRLAAWLRVSGVGNKFLSLKVSKQEARQEQQLSASATYPSADEDVPF